MPTRTQRAAVARRLLPVALLAALTACFEFGPIAASVCGNGVVEGESEDCDLLVPNARVCRPPTATDACRFPCDTVTACPDGMVCVTARQACVRPSGAFTAGARFADGVAATNIDLVDTDGDGSTDTYVGYNVPDATRVYFTFPSDRDASSLRPRRIPEWPVPPHAARSLEGDRSASRATRGVLAPIATGVTMLHREATGEVQPDARFGLLAGQNIPSGVLRSAVRVFAMKRTIGRKGSVRDGSAVVGTRDGTLFVAANWVAPAETDMSACDATSGGFARLVPDRRADEVVYAGAANVAEGSPCDELVVIFKDGEVRSFESCNASSCALPASSVVERRGRLETPIGATELSEAVAADVDGDGHADVLGAWRRGDRESAPSRAKAFSIALGFGAGTFPIGVPFFVDVANGAKLAESDEGLTVFRERRDVDGIESGRTFAVIADRILRFDGDLEPTTPPSPFQRVTAFQVSWPTGAARWEDPTAEDLDRDGVVDVVLRSGPRLVVLRGNGLGAFGSSVVEASTTIRAKAVGDFDGDGLLDVAISRDFFTDASTVPVNIDVAYGAGATRFGSWVRVITAKNPASTLVPLRIPAFNGADSLLAVAPDADAGGPELVTLIGDGTQGGLFPSAAAQCGGPLANTANRLVPRAGTIARVLASGEEPRDFLFLGGEAATKERSETGRAFEGFALADVSGAKIDLSAVDCRTLAGGASLLYANAADLCGDAADEVVTVSVDATGTPIFSLVTLTLRGATLDATFAPLPIRAGVAGTTLRAANVLAIPHDLDGDGDRDLLVRIGSEAGVVWSEPNASGRCDPAAFRYERLPLDAAAAGDDVLGISALSRGARRAMSVVALTKSATAPLRRFDRTAEGTFAASALDLPIDRSAAALGGPTAMDIGDVDGDGIEDIVLADRRGIRVHYGIESPRRRP
jgi:hypothetical protein